MFLLAPLILLGPSAGGTQIGAFETNCRLVGPTLKGGYQFISTCQGRTQSPDKRYAIVQRAYKDDQPTIELQDSRDRKITTIPQLSDDMPFDVAWAPNSRWILVSHHVGSFMDRPEVYEIRNSRAISRDQFRRTGQKLAQKMFSCLPQSSRDWASGSALGWSKDGRRIAWVFITRTDMCSPDYGGMRVPYEKSWKPVWMISEIPSGRIVSGSAHVDQSEGALKIPKDHRYDEFR